ncbi:transient receptor potential cation channel subfamily A member 1-like isoform X2 [Dysidea avara]
MLHAAIVNKRIKIIEELFDCGTSLFKTATKDEFQNSPLILAVKSYGLDSSLHEQMSSSVALSVTLNTRLSMADFPVGIQVLKLLLEFGADVNSENVHGDTPLILAVKSQNVEVVRELVTVRSLKVNKTNVQKKTALHYAVASDSVEIVTELLDNDARVLQADHDGYTPIHTACKYGRYDLLVLMFKRNPEVEKVMIDQKTNDGKTPLLVAKCAFNYNAQTINYLITKGSNLASTDNHKNTILHLYSDTDDLATCKEILFRPGVRELLMETNFSLETPLHVVASYGHYHTCFEMLELLPPNAMEIRDISNYTPMMRAIESGHLQVVKGMLMFGYKVHQHVNRQKTLLEWAIENNHSILIKAMYSHCTDEKAILEDAFNLSLFDLIKMATQFGKDSILRLLLQEDSDRATKYHDEALHIAVTHNNLNCVKVLYEHKAVLSSRINGADTVLHIACRHGYCDIVKFLLCYGVSTEYCNHKEGSPLACAAAEGHELLVTYMINSGAALTVDCPDHDNNNTPLLLAAKNGHCGVVKILLDQPNIDVNARNSSDYNCLCEAIANGRRSAVLTIIRSSHWEKAMMFRKRNNNDSPMRLLIRHMPDVAELVLYKCMEVGDDVEHNITSLTYSFKFLDDYDISKDFVSHYTGKMLTRCKKVPTRSNGSRRRTSHNSPMMEMEIPMLTVEDDTNGQAQGDRNTEVNKAENNDWLQPRYTKENHTLQLMVECGRISLLEHPVVHELLLYKWQYFGLPAFVFHFISYLLFVALLTATVLVAPLPQESTCSVPGCWSDWGSWSNCSNPTHCGNYNMTRTRTRQCSMPKPGFGYGKDCNGSHTETMVCSNETYDGDDFSSSGDDGDDINTQFMCKDYCRYKNFQHKKSNCTERGMSTLSIKFLDKATSLLFIITTFLLLLNVLKLSRRGINFFRILASWIDTAFLISSIVFVVLFLHTKDNCYCASTTTWEVGVIALFCGWIGLIVHLNKLPATGIVINMLQSILRAFSKLAIIGVLLCFAFALPFYILLTLPGRRTPFSDLGRSFLKIFVMTTGELDFDAIFVNHQELVDAGLVRLYPTLTIFLWIIFVITMPILFNNLLVGLAVGDTQQQLSKAKLTNYLLQIRIITELETAFPVLRSIGKLPEVTIQHNRKTWLDWLRNSTEFDHRVNYYNRWKDKIHVHQLLEEDKVNPQQKIITVQNSHTEQLHNLETLLMHIVEKLNVSTDEKAIRTIRVRADTLFATSPKPNQSDDNPPDSVSEI